MKPAGHGLALLVHLLLGVGPLLAEPLPAVVDRVLLQQPGVRSAQALLNAAQAQITQARSEFLPTASLSYRDSKARDETQGVAFDRTIQRSDASLRWNLFNGGADLSRLRSSNFNRDAADADLDETLERVAAEITENYTDVVRLRQTINSLEATITRQEALRQRVAQRVDAGRIPPSELDLMRVRLIQNRNNLGQLRSQLGTAEYRYRLLTGQAPQELIFPSLLPADPAIGDDTLVDLIRQRNPRLRAALQRVGARQAEIGIARGSLLPAVDLELTRRLANHTDPIPVTDSSGSDTLRINLDIPLGGKNFARHNEAIERHRAALADAELLDHDLTREAGDLYRQGREAREINELLEQRVLSAQRVAAAYELHFEAGRRSLNDLSIAQDDLYDAQRSLLDNHARQTVIEARILSMLGELRRALRTQYRAAPIAAALLATKPAEPAKALVIASPLTVLPEPAEQSQLEKRLETWVAAWSAKDFPAYRAFYADDFQPASGESTARWAAERQRRIARASAPSIRIEAVESEFTGAELARTHFIQHYQAGNYRDIVRKQLLWRRINGDWRIVGENLLPSAP